MSFSAIGFQRYHRLVKRWSLALLALLGVAWLPMGFGWCQSSSSSGQGTGETADVARRMPLRARSGGGSLADFNQLIQLIQTTVNANWDVDGGEDTIQTSVSGVWLDPKGKLQRRPRRAGLPSLHQGSPAESVFEIPALGELQASTPLRWISFGELAEQLRLAMVEDTLAKPSMQLLGGITRLDYLAFEPSAGDWYLGGPAGELVLDWQGHLIGRATGLPPVLLEDLLTLAPWVLRGRGALGCSIDPVPERLRAVHELVTSPIARRSLTQQADRWCEQLARTLGDQQATVFGIPAASPTATALLIADEHMKRIGLGLENGPGRLLSYWEEAEKRGEVPKSSMVRWWFGLRPQIEIGMSSDARIFAIESPTVAVLSQQQWMDQTGQRYDSLERDAAADAFAAGFTANFEALQQLYPAIYGRLRHISDLCIFLRIVREETKAGGYRYPKLFEDPSIQPQAVPVRWIPSIAAWRKTSNGRVAAMVSGGVALEERKAELRKSVKAGFSAPGQPFSLR